MTKLDNILDAGRQQLSLDVLLATLDAENRDGDPQTIAAVANLGAPISPEKEPEPHDGNGFEPGQSVGHTDYPTFRGIFVGPGAKDGQAKVMVKSGWTCDPPIWPVTVPTAKLVEV